MRRSDGEPSACRSIATWDMTVLPFATQIKNRSATIKRDCALEVEVTLCVRGVISPLLANLYFRRFLLAWNSHGHRDQLGAHVVNYADDFVICCRPGNGEAALATMRHLMTRLGLTVNEAKTRLIRIPDGSCELLRDTIRRFHGRDGGAYIGTRPSRKAVRALLRKIHNATTPQKHADTPEHRVAEISSLRRGWAGSFNQGPVTRIYETARRYTERRVRRWLMRRRGQKGTGYRQYPDEYLYQKLGLYALPRRRADPPSAKA